MAAFVPRIVQRKDDKTSKKIAAKRNVVPHMNTLRKEVQVVDLRGGTVEECSSKREQNDESIKLKAQIQTDDEVVSFSKNQRWPEPGEPVCIMCGRYGAYVCDQTEEDVCSLECKAKHLHMVGHNQTESTRTEDVSSTDNQMITNCQMLQQTHHTQELSVTEDTEYVYKEHPTITGLSKGQIQQLHERVQIKMKGENIALPILEFFHCCFDERLSENLSSHGYLSPTPIQMQVLPVALSGRDIMACANTGSGKTAAFLLPMITRIHHITGNCHPRSSKLHCIYGLILAPTRELCIQIESQTKELVQGLSNMRTALLIGGLPVPPQLHRLKMGVQIVVATPGRLVEILSRESVDLSHVISCVVDEVDTMLQLGFEHQVQQIIGQLSDSQQTLLISATIPAAIENMASKLLRNPVYISAGTPSTPTQAVKQLVLWVEEKSKKKQLFAILKNPKHYNPPAVVFVDSKVGADLLAEAVTQVCHISCMSMHGDKPQSERTQIVQSFLSGACPVIISTAVLGRGVDLLNIKQVINFDMPSTYEEYVHQVGRAGRLGASGWAITFVNNANKNLFLQLIENLQPMGVTLPAEITQSVYVQQQRDRARLGIKRKEMDEIVNQSNLMDLLRKRSVKKRK